MRIGSTGVAALAFVVATAGVFAPPATAEGNDIEGEIQAALTAYRNGNMAEALDALRLAEQWLLEIQADDLSTVFPKLEGWELETGEAQAAGQMVFGGGVTASATYTRGEEDRMTVEIVANSPMLSMVSGFIGMAAASGKKVVRVHGTKSILDTSDSEVELMIPYDGSVLITIKTNTTTDDAMACAEGLGWDTINSMSAQ